MKQQLSPLEILESIALAGTAAGTVSVVLLSQNVGYAIGPGAFSLVLGAANRRRSHLGEQNSSELVQADQRLSADLASVRQQVQGLPSASDYSSLKSTVQNISNSLNTIDQQKAELSRNVGVELNPIRQDIVQLRSQYGNLHDFLAQLRDRIETLPPPDKLQTIEHELKQMEAKLAQLPSKLQKMTAEASSGELAEIQAEIQAEIAALKEQLLAVTPTGDGDAEDAIAPELQELQQELQELQELKRQVAALESTADLLTVSAQSLAEKEEIRSLYCSLLELQEQQQELLKVTGNDRAVLASLGDRLEQLQEQFTARAAEISPGVGAEELQELQQKYQELSDRLECDRLEWRTSAVAVETKEGQIVELTGVEEVLAKIAGAVSEIKQEVDDRMGSIESVELKTIQAQLLDQQQILTELQEQYQSLLASTAENGNLIDLSESEYSQKIASLERGLASTAESVDRIESSLSTNGFSDREPVAIDANLSNLSDLYILTQEIEQIGILKDTVYQLSGNVEILDRQVHALTTGSPDSMTGQLLQQMDALTAKVEELSEPHKNGDLLAAYETVMLRLERVEAAEAAYLDLEAQTKENQDLNCRQNEEITDQFSLFNAQLCDVQQEIGSIGQQLTGLTQELEDISGSELEAIRYDVVAIQATVSDLVNRLESDLDRTNVSEKVQELEQALSILETNLSTKLSGCVAQLDDNFHQLQLQTNQLAAEQASSQVATSQIETLIDNSIGRQMEEISQLLQDVSPCDYELVFDRPTIYDCLVAAIENSNKRLIIVCPWLNREAMSDLLDKLSAFLERNGQLQIGWGHLADINNGEFPLRIHSSWQVGELSKRRQSYDALNDLEILREKYPHQVEYKVLGTHENFLVSDNNLALISSHHFLSSDRLVPEREVGLKTSSLKIIQGLIDRFNDPLLKPGNAEAYYNRGFERLEVGDYQGAMEDYQRAAERDPDRPTIYNNLGLTKYHRGDAPGAIADYTKAIELDPDDPVTYFNRAVAYYKMGNYRCSITDYTQVIQRQDGIRISAENTGAYFQRAEAYRQLGEYGSAISDYTMAIRLSPNDPVAYNNRGLARYNQGDYLGSIADYSEALALNPDDAIAYSNRGVSRLKSGDYTGAVGDFDRAISLKANYASAYNNRGLARLEIGDRPGAIADLETAAELFAAIGNIPMNKHSLDSLQRLGSQES